MPRVQTKPIVKPHVPPSPRSKDPGSHKCKHNKTEDEVHDCCGSCRKQKRLRDCTYVVRCSRCINLDKAQFARYLAFVHRNKARQERRKSSPKKAKMQSGDATGAGNADEVVITGSDPANTVPALKSPLPAEEEIQPSQNPANRRPTRARSLATEVVDLACMSLTDMQDSDMQVPSIDTLVAMGLHPNTLKLAQSSEQVSNMPIREVSVMAFKVYGTPRSQPAPSTSASQRQPTPQRQPSESDSSVHSDPDAEASDEDDVIIGSGDEAAEVASQTSSGAGSQAVGFRELFSFISDNARVDARIIDGDSQPFRPPALEGDRDEDDLTGRVCLTATALLNNIVRSRQAVVAKDLGAEGRVTPGPQKGVASLCVKMRPYAPADDVWPTAALKYTPQKPWLMPVPSSANIPLTAGDACLLESAMRETSNIADRVNAALEAMRPMCNELWQEPMFQAIFKFIARAAMDITKRSTFAAAALVQVGTLQFLCFKKTGGGTASCCPSVCRSPVVTPFLTVTVC